MNPEDVGHSPLLTVTNGVGPGFFNLDNLLAPQNIAIIVAAWGVTELVSRAAGGASVVRQRVLPLLPLALSITFVLLTANWQPQATFGERVLLGVLLGTVTVWGHTVAKKLGLHDWLPFMKPPQTPPDDAPPPT